MLQIPIPLSGYLNLSWGFLDGFLGLWKIQMQNSVRIAGFDFFFDDALRQCEGPPEASITKFFPYETSFNENYLAIANWDHQYEWRNDLELDYDKLHDYAPWVITTWNEEKLKPLTETYKRSLNWDLRQLESEPKLKPWLSNLETQTYESFRAYKDLQLINEAIENIIGNDKELKKLKDLKGYLLKIRAYFRDLNY